MSLPSHTDSGEPDDRPLPPPSPRSRRKMSPRYTIRWQLVGHLHPDGLLAGDRSQDADVGRGERVGDVVLELGDLRDLGAGREPQLVARDARAGDAADDLCLDAEVAQRLDQRLGDLVLVGGVGALALAGLAQQLRVGQPVAAALGLGHRRSAARPGGSAARDRARRLRGCASGARFWISRSTCGERVLLGVERVALGRDGHRALGLGLGIRQQDLDPRARPRAPRAAARPASRVVRGRARARWQAASARGAARRADAPDQVADPAPGQRAAPRRPSGRRRRDVRRHAENSVEVAQ